MYNRNTNTISLIVQSPIAPRSNNVLWDDGTSIKIWRKGIWVPIGGGGSSDSYWGYDEVDNTVFITGYNKVQINCDLVVNGNISSKNWNDMWELSEDGTQIFTTKQVLIKNSLIVEGDTSSGGAGEDIPGYGASSMSQLEDVDLSSLGNNYVLIYDSSSSKWVSKPQSEIVPDLSGYLKIEDANTTFVKLDTFNTLSDEVSTLNTKVTLVHNWYNAISPYWYYDTELEAIVCTKNLIVYLDTSSGGEGQDTPASGIRGIYVNGTPYTDTDGDGFIDLGTISGGGGVSGDYLPLTGGRITGNSLDIGREDNYASAFVKIITNASTSADYGTSIRHYEKSSGSYTYKGLLIDKNGAYYSNNGSNYGLIHSGNIGSHKAGGLATPRSIWGQSFDGTNDVSGSLCLYTAPAGAWWHRNIYVLKSDNTTTLSALGFYGNGNDLKYTYIGTDYTAPWLLINSSGNVGIGTTTDLGYKLDVVGNARITDSLELGAGRLHKYTLYSQVSGFKLIDKNNDERLGFYSYNKSCFIENLYGGTENCGIQLFDTGAISLFGGNVGIGTTSPSSKLSVHSNAASALPSLGALATEYTIEFGHAGKYGTYLGTLGSGNGFIQQGRSDGTATAYNLLLQPIAGNVGIGTTNPQYKLDVNGDSRINGNLIVSGDTSSGSDIRFKDIIKNKTLKIEDIAKAPLFTFKWNDREDNVIHLGSSAQYWEKVCPWLVTGEDFKSLNYATLGVAMGISLAKKAVNHEARIKELEKEIKRLKEERYGG